MHDVRKIIHKATDAGFVPWIVPLAPLSARQHHVYFLGRMAVVRISRMRSQMTYADPNIAPNFEPLRTGDCRVGVVVEELLPLRLSAGSDFPAELRFDYGKGLGQRADGA